MDDLMKCLYDFAYERRIGGIDQDPEYQETSKSVEMQMKKVQNGMNEQQQQELYLLLASLSARSSIESEYVFRAALRLFGELNALVRA